MKAPRLPLIALALASASPALFGAIGDGLLVDVNFDNNTSNIAAGSSIVATTTGTNAATPTYTSSGMFGSAATFNNTNGNTTTLTDWALSLGNMDAYYITDFSFSLWINTTSSADRGVFGNSDWNSGNNPGWLVNTNTSAGEGKFKTTTGTRQNESLAIHGGTWQNVIGVADFTTDPTTPKVYWYLNGTLLNPAGDSFGTGTLGAGYATLIGGSGNGTYGANAVSVDDVGIWSRKLTGTEIAALQTGSIASLVAVPEPSVYGLLGTGALVAASVVRRRRRIR